MTRTRRLVQIGFLALTLIGVFLVRGNAERWCPFGGVEAIYLYATEGNMLCSLGVSNFYILAAVLLITLLLRRAFCGYVCPIGALSEWIHAGTKRLGIRPLQVPYRLDRVLAKLKYVVLAVILYFTWTFGELEFRVADPCYALISRHGEDITFWAYVVAAAIVVGAVFMLIPFCRWLCPLAAVFHPISRFALTSVRRDEDVCVNCGLCSKVCPTAIPVAKLKNVTAARCLSCFSCVEVCPKEEHGAISWGPPPALGRRWPQGVLVGTLLVCLAGAVAAVYAVPLPAFSRVAEGRGEAPAITAAAELEVYGLSCRGKATLFSYFIERDDEFEIPGYLKIEAWPGPGAARTRITYDPSQTDEQAIKEALTEPYYDGVGDVWRSSPFDLAGYDPLGLD
ncbi:MAG TPA: 4Fe-4S binding protein [Phycisphaerae bacterium]|nr:4Fe-4S binding protein [Phycisphaerae bacterium]